MMVPHHSANSHTLQTLHKRTLQPFALLDYQMLTGFLLLLAFGVVMVTSASMAIVERETGSAFYTMKRQLVYVAMGLAAMYITVHIKMELWERISQVLFIFAVFLLLLVLIPGIGRTVNGATRWLNFGIFNLQVSEPARLLMIMYLSGYLVRRHLEVTSSLKGFLKPMILFGIASFLILLQPDFGAVVVMFMTALGMLFVAGVRFFQFVAFMLLMVVVFIGLAVSSPYRLQRLTTFVDPWADPFNAGFQLTQSLMAFGSGHWFGLGLGESVQKLFYLPEAHNDFLFAIIAEELGLVGVLATLLLFGFVIYRIFHTAVLAERKQQLFNAYLAQGLGLWFAIQAMINMGVNMGLLPTKGLTLPFMSAGGSSLIVMCMAAGLLLRISAEARLAGSQVVRRKRTNTNTGGRNKRHQKAIA